MKYFCECPQNRPYYYYDACRFCPQDAPVPNSGECLPCTNGTYGYHTVRFNVDSDIWVRSVGCKCNQDNFWFNTSSSFGGPGCLYCNGLVIGFYGCRITERCVSSSNGPRLTTKNGICCTSSQDPQTGCCRTGYTYKNKNRLCCKGGLCCPNGYRLSSNKQVCCKIGGFYQSGSNCGDYADPA